MPLPERLGRLHQVDRLGIGGFSSVWLYRDDELRSDVAVKALADNWAQREDVRERFLEEARILRAADSDHVVRVYDIGEVDETPYFVMTYADRGTVADLLDEGRVSLERTVALVRQAGDGLEVLHGRGVVHRDIKPQNLLLASDGLGRERLMVADLGVAKALIHASGLTDVVGTPAYMAPEQALGGGIDERADVHGLAAVAYHLLTGHVARNGGVTDLVHANLPPAPSVFVAGLAGGRRGDPARPRARPGEPLARRGVVRRRAERVRPGRCHGPRPAPGRCPQDGRRVSTSSTRRGLLLALTCLVVAVAMFGASWAAVSMLR